MQRLLGDKRVTFHALFVYAGSGAGNSGDVFSESFVTWYDDCEFNPNPNCHNQWRLYYPDTLAISKARPYDTLLVARIKDDELLLVMAPPQTASAIWMQAHYSADARLQTVAPPAPAATGPAALPLLSLPQNFGQAKKMLSRHIYANDNDRQTFYCGCDYTKDNKIEPLSCGYVPRRAASVRLQLEWEHIVPAAYMGKGRACWEQGDKECVSSSGNAYKGRKCRDKVDAQFRAVEGDVNNLVPEIGELNADRRDFPYRELPPETRQYGACDFEVDTQLKAVQPAIPLRGFIGRTWLYMHAAYNVPMTDEDLKVYQAWADAYPVQQWEKDRAARIQQALALKTEFNRAK